MSHFNYVVQRLSRKLVTILPGSVEPNYFLVREQSTGMRHGDLLPMVLYPFVVKIPGFLPPVMIGIHALAGKPRWGALFRLNETVGLVFQALLVRLWLV